MKICTICEENKQVSDFYKNKATKDGYANQCKKCKEIYKKKWRKDNPEKHGAQKARHRKKNLDYYNAYQKAWQEKNPKAAAQYRLMYRFKKYGITFENFLAILLEQGNVCAICKVDFPDDPKQTHIDHDHNTNKVRGILCRSCNVGLGHFKDNPALLVAAAKYLDPEN